MKITLKYTGSSTVWTPQIKPTSHALPKNAEEKTRGEENQTTFQTMKITEDIPRTI